MATRTTTKRSPYGYRVRPIRTPAHGHVWAVLNAGGDALYFFDDQRTAETEARILNEAIDAPTPRARTARTI